MTKETPTFWRLLGRKRTLGGLGAISAPGFTKLLFDGASVVDVANTYWTVVSEPWFQWACVVGGFALIYWASRDVARESRERQDGLEGARQDALDAAETRFAEKLAPLESQIVELASHLDFDRAVAMLVIDSKDIHHAGLLLDAAEVAAGSYGDLFGRNYTGAEAAVVYASFQEHMRRPRHHLRTLCNLLRPDLIERNDRITEPPNGQLNDRDPWDLEKNEGFLARHREIRNEINEILVQLRTTLTGRIHEHHAELERMAQARKGVG